MSLLSLTSARRKIRSLAGARLTAFHLAQVPPIWCHSVFSAIDKNEFSHSASAPVIRRLPNGLAVVGTLEGPLLASHLALVDSIYANFSGNFPCKGTHRPLVMSRLPLLLNEVLAMRPPVIGGISISPGALCARVSPASSALINSLPLRTRLVSNQRCRTCTNSTTAICTAATSGHFLDAFHLFLVLPCSWCGVA